MNARRTRRVRWTGSAAAIGLALFVSAQPAWSKVKQPPPPDRDDPATIAPDVGPVVPDDTPAGHVRTYKDKHNHGHKLRLAPVAPQRFQTRPQQAVVQLLAESSKKNNKQK